MVRDNDSAHVSGATQQFIKEQKINELKYWPAFDLDFNRIENLRGIIIELVKRIWWGKKI